MRLGNALLLLGVVVVVEIVNVLSGFLNRLLTLLGELLCPLLVLRISLLAPLTDDRGLLFLLDEGVVARVVVYARSSGDASAGDLASDGLCIYLLDGSWGEIVE